MPGHDEAAFETAIEFGLTSAGGYEKRRYITSDAH